MFTLIMLALLQELPGGAQQIVIKAEAKIAALRKSYEDACTKIRVQQLAELQRAHDAIVKGDPAGAATIKAKIDQLAADIGAVGNGPMGVEKWLQGKWIIMFQGSGDVMEFKGDKVIGSGIGDRTKGRIIVDAGTIQIIWDSGYVETMRVSKTWADETAGMGRNGPETFKRLK